MADCDLKRRTVGSVVIGEQPHPFERERRHRQQGNQWKIRLHMEHHRWHIIALQSIAKCKNADAQSGGLQIGRSLHVRRQYGGGLLESWSPKPDWVEATVQSFYYRKVHVLGVG
eukprot:scaffold325_cov343-Pavlova_lutheri.AAC.8